MIRPIGARGRRAAVVVLLAVPVLATLAVPLYARAAPALAGVPFFYAYQLAWVPLSIVLMAAALALTNDDDETDLPPDLDRTVTEGHSP